MKRYGLDIAAFIWGVAEATLFFIVPDVLLSYIGLKRGGLEAARASLIAAIGASVGGVIMFLWSASDPIAATNAVAAVPAISELMMEQAAEDMRMNWFDATLFGPLTSTPFKVYAVLAPFMDVSLWAFALASIAARLPRFLLISLGVAIIARYARGAFSERQLFWVLIGAWLLFYAVFFAIMPN